MVVVRSTLPPTKPLSLPTTLAPGASLPAYGAHGDAGADLRSTERVLIPAGEHKLVSTGVAVQLKPGLAGFVYSRSGLAAKNGVFVLNAPGLIDSGYRGELKVILANFSQHDFMVEEGDRIAQFVVQEVLSPEFHTVEAFDDETERGAGGFGSTGVK